MSFYCADQGLLGNFAVQVDEKNYTSANPGHINISGELVQCKFELKMSSNNSTQEHKGEFALCIAISIATCNSRLPLKLNFVRSFALNESI